MKRVIKYWSTHEGVTFSNCSTQYEILPVLVDDSASLIDLKKLSLKLGLSSKGKDYEAPVPQHGCGFGSLEITHALQIGTKKSTSHGFGSEVQELPAYLGFITLPPETDTIPYQESLDTKLTEDQASEIVNCQLFDLSDVGEQQGGGIVLVKEGWGWYHDLPLMGYDLEHLEKEIWEVDDHGFSDDTYRCSGCGVYDSRDSGYTYNHRQTEDGESLGTRCGCWDSYCEEHVEDFIIEDIEKINPIELNMAESLKEKGQLKFIERYMGRMTDPGRGGHYGGEYCSPANPNEVLDTLPKDKKYIVSHDESGQFQTYWSVWEVV